MAACVETMMYTGEKPWHGLGTKVEEAPTSSDAIRLAGLDWSVIQKDLYIKDDNGNFSKVPLKANVRDTDCKFLGGVTNRYGIIQNYECFEFTDKFIGDDVRYETAGSLNNGKKIWLLARMNRTTVAEETIDPYMVFMNTHDGTGAVRVAMTPIRVVCNNTLNLALSTASRHWSCAHKGNIMDKLDAAKFTLCNAKEYMEALEEEFGELKLKKINETQLRSMVDTLLKIEYEDLYNKSKSIEPSSNVIDIKEINRQKRFEEKLNRKRNDLITLYFDKPDLRGTPHTAFRFINAVSDYATHTPDHKNTKNYSENLFIRTVEGHSMIDAAYEIARAA